MEEDLKPSLRSARQKFSLLLLFQGKFKSRLNFVDISFILFSVVDVCFQEDLDLVAARRFNASEVNSEETPLLLKMLLPTGIRTMLS